MASLESAAKRYTLAAFELAQERGSLREWQNALDRLAAFMSGSDVAMIMANSRVPQESKQQLLMAALSDLPGLTLNLGRLLVRKNRTALAPLIAEQFRQLVEEQEGIARAKATTAVPLSDADREALSARLRQQTGREVVLDTEVDAALLGGVVVQIGDRLVDASTKARLEALRESLVGAF
jgi:F-type H+-transporting ATPase subunit delta